MGKCVALFSCSISSKRPQTDLMFDQIDCILHSSCLDQTLNPYFRDFLSFRDLQNLIFIVVVLRVLFHALFIYCIDQYID